MTFLDITGNATISEWLQSLAAYLPNKYLQSLAILLLVVILAKLLVWMSKTIILQLTEKTKTKFDDKIVEAVRTPIFWMFIAIGGRTALIPLQLSEKISSALSGLLNSAIILVLTIITIRVVDILLNIWGKQWAKRTKSSVDDALLPLFHKAAKVAMVILAAFFIAGEWNIDITGILAGVGIAGLALGFAVKDSLANIFGGISLILDKAIKVGDFIEINGTSGEVTDVGLRSTRIRTWDNELLIIPNGSLANTEFKNWKLPDLKARVVVEFGVEYGTSHEKVKKIVYDIIKKNKNIIEEPAPIVRFKDMGDSALLFGAYCWVNDISERWNTKETLVCDIYDALNKHKIGIPFPQMDVHMTK